MNQILLTTFEERLSAVPRWSIVRTIQKQTVDQHSFRVAIIAKRLAPLWINIYSEHLIANCMEYALHHDQYEAFTGDIPSPAGHAMDKAALEAKFKHHTLYQPELISETTKAVVKAADYVEALVFLQIEMSLGNSSVEVIFDQIRDNLYKHLEGHERLHLMKHVDDTLFLLSRPQDPLDTPADFSGDIPF